MNLKRKQTLWGAIGGGVMAATMIMVLILGGPPSLIPHRQQTSTGATTLLWLYAPRDMGRLPARGTSAGQFCGTVGSLGAPDHCWQFGGSGTIADLGEDGTKWDLAKVGSPRYGIAAGVPVADSTGWVDFTTEQAAQGTTTSDYWKRNSTAVQDATSVSVTIVYATPVGSTSNPLITFLSATPARYWSVSASALNVLTMQVVGAGGTKTMTPSLASYRANLGPGYRCCTMVADRSGANLGKVWCNGVDRTPAGNDFNGVGDFASTGGQLAVMRGATGTLARARVDYVSATQADHIALCGSISSPLVPTHSAYADSTWSRGAYAAGAARCYAVATGQAACFSAADPAYRWTGTGYAWASEPTRTNRLLYSAAPSCTTNWTCAGGATITAGVGPAGLIDAATITATGTVKVTGTGYTASAPLHLRAWVKVAAGVTLDASHVGGAGHWTIDGTAIGDAWTEVYSGHPAVTEVQAWSATGAGAANVTFSAGAASVWIPTLTHVAGKSVIPSHQTVLAGVSPYWSINNIDGRYWQHSDSVTAVGDATCMLLGPSITLTGQLLAECTGDVASLKIDGSSRRTGATVILLAGQSNAQGRGELGTLEATAIPLPDHFNYWSDEQYAVASVRRGKYGSDSFYFGSEPYLSHLISDDHPTASVLLIKRTYGGTSLYGAWHYVEDASRLAEVGDEGRYTYDMLAADIVRILDGQTPAKVILVWAQGENDAIYEVAANEYATGLGEFVTHLESDSGITINQLVLKRLGMVLIGAYPYRATVRAAQDAAAAASPGGAATSVLDSDTWAIDGGDRLHLTAAGSYQFAFAADAVITP